MRKLITKRNIFVVLLIVGVGLWWWKGQETKKKEKSERKIVSVVRKDLVETLSVSGKVRAEKQAELNFQSGGKLAMVRVKSGEKVERGEWLMGLDTGDLKAIETKAWYSYLAADANAKEVEDDLKGHDKDETFSQKNERVAAQTARDSAYENWLSARRAVDNAVLKSPFSGVVASVSTLSVGDTVGVSDGVVVFDPESVYFDIEIDESDLGKVSEGMEVVVTLDAFEGEEFKGQLSDIGYVSRLSNTGATVFPAKVTFPVNDMEKLRLGMNGDAEIVTDKVGGVLTLPIEAVIDNKVEKENGSKTSVKVGLEGESEVEIKEGLNEGDRVVVK
jgi:RND family efflux transporter MFP subunit